MWGTSKYTNICVIGVSEEEERNDKKNSKNYSNDLPNLMVNINLYIPEAQQVPNRINSKKTTVRHILVKILKAKNKEEILKPVREK